MSAYGIEVAAVADEAEAVALLTGPAAQDPPVALLLCDYRLADGVDGLDVGLRLSRNGGRATPLLLITGETSPDRLQRVRESRVPVLFKPVVADRLLEAMSEAVRAG